MFKLEDITVVICNWMQTRFTLGAVKNVKKYYPDIKVIVIDDGSSENKLNDFNRAYARPGYSKDERLDNEPMKLIKSLELDFRLVFVHKHMGHGSALDYGVDEVTTPLMLTMDNDIRIIKPGLVEEYLSKMNEDPENIYAVGTTFTESNCVNNTGWKGSWIDPWFSLYQLEPIRQMHLTFCDFTFPYPGQSSFHIGTGAFLHTMLTHEDLHRPKTWKAVHYPSVEEIDSLWHLKKHPDDPPNSKNVINWHKYIDG